MRNMSFSLTTQQFIDGTKDVTRRKGWKFLKPGDQVRAVKKAMGLRPGEKIEPLGVIEIIKADRIPLHEIDAEDARREGFPKLDGAGFVTMFCEHMGGDRSQEVTRIEFKKVRPAS